MHKPVLGLIGGIGSGKSRVAAELVRHGGAIIAGDHLGHEGLRQADIKARVVERWGKGILDDEGEVNRRVLGERVFAKVAELRALETLLFPWIERRIGEEIAAGQQDPAVKFLVLDAAVMLEAGWDRFCDRVIFVEAPRSVRLERLARQRNWNEEEVSRREQAQKPLTDKKARADALVDNSGALGQLTSQVADVLQRLGLEPSGTV